MCVCVCVCVFVCVIYMYNYGVYKLINTGQCYSWTIYIEAWQQKSVQFSSCYRRVYVRLVQMVESVPPWEEH